MTSVRHLALATMLALVLALSVWTSAGAATPKNRLVSVRSNGTQSNDPSAYPSVSGNGRFVAFESYATNLVAGDTNGANDIFVHDRKTKKTKRVSVRSNGNQANGGSNYAAISANGRFVTFESMATNLVGGDTNGDADVFVHDRRTGKTTRVSVSSNGAQGDSGSGYSSISNDGRFVAFASFATNLVANDNNNAGDVFVHNRATKKTKRVSVSSSGVEGNLGSGAPAISGKGRFVSFYSESSNLVANDTNGNYDIFVHDRERRKTRRVSVHSNGTQSNGSSFGPTVSNSGRFVSFFSSATNLVANDTNSKVDIFLHDRTTRKTRRVNVHSNGTQANVANSYDPAISGSGRFVAFYSGATNLVNGDGNGVADVFMHDRKTKKTRLVSVRSNGVQGNGTSSDPAISKDGRFVAFVSNASNLIAGDINGFEDILLRGPLN